MHSYNADLFAVSRRSYQAIRACAEEVLNTSLLGLVVMESSSAYNTASRSFRTCWMIAAPMVLASGATEVDRCCITISSGWYTSESGFPTVSITSTVRLHTRL